MAEPTCQQNWLISADNRWRWKFSTGWDGLGADLGPDSSEAVAAGSEGRLQGGLAGCQVAGAVPGIVHTLPTTCPVHSQQPGQADPWIRQWTGIVWAFLHSVGGRHTKGDRRRGRRTPQNGTGGWKTMFEIKRKSRLGWKGHGGGKMGVGWFIAKCTSAQTDLSFLWPKSFGTQTLEPIISQYVPVKNCSRILFQCSWQWILWGYFLQIGFPCWVSHQFIPSLHSWMLSASAIFQRKRLFWVYSV